jgi:CubicO group peptidase (beta-lactamase class C family)
MHRNALIPVILSAVVVAGAGAAIVEVDPEFGARMDRFVEDALDASGLVPGFGLVVVKDDQVIHIGGYGYRDVEAQLPVTSDTGFYIASATKSFTGMAASVLAVRNELDLDAPISRYLPELRLPEPMSPHAITVRALLTHQTGIHNREVQRQLAFVRSLTKEEYFDLLLTDSQRLPTSFMYSNLGYNIFGYLLEARTGNPWQQVVAETVLDPVGMSNTTTSIETASKGEFAWPYSATGDSFERMPIKSEDTMHSAGGMVSTPDDLGRWLIANLNHGVIDGTPALDARAVAAAHTSYATTDRSYYRFHRTGYGLGWYHSDFEGELLIHHFGGFNGYHAHVSFMPEHGIGVATLMNTDSHRTSTLAHIVAGNVYERLLHGSVVDAKYQQEVEGWAARSIASKRYDESLSEARAILAGGDVETATSRFVDALHAAVDADVVTEGSVNRLGYELLDEPACEAALAVLDFNADNHPDSPNVHDSLGEAYEKCERLEEARRSYAEACARSKDGGGGNLEAYEANLSRVSARLEGR